MSEFICPEAEYHGNPFRYCGFKGCGWIEESAPKPTTLTIPVYKWEDAHGAPIPYIVVGGPGQHLPALWDGVRWIELSEEVLKGIDGPT